VLLVLYVVSMYFTVRYGSPPSQDPQQAQTQKIMAIVSPAMIAFFGLSSIAGHRRSTSTGWRSTVFTVAQQYIMFRRYGLIGGKKDVRGSRVATAALAAEGPKQLNGAVTGSAAASNGKRRYRSKKRSRR